MIKHNEADFIQFQERRKLLTKDDDVITIKFLGDAVALEDSKKEEKFVGLLEYRGGNYVEIYDDPVFGRYQLHLEGLPYVPNESLPYVSDNLAHLEKILFDYLCDKE